MPIYFQSNQSNFPINLESIGHHWPQVSIHRPEGYPFFHWLQTEKGEGIIHLSKQKLRLREGEGILIAPFVPHSYIPTTTWQTNFATFSGHIFDVFNIENDAHSHFFASDQPDFSYQDWIKDTIDFHLASQMTEQEMSARSYHFLLSIFHSEKYVDSLKHPLYQQYVLPIIKIIEQQYSEHLTVEALAETIFISPQYLTRLFKRFTQLSPYQFIVSYRMNKAKELLVQYPDLDIQDVAFKTGFQSTSQFIVMFKQHTTYTPKNFRTLHHSLTI